MLVDRLKRIIGFNPLRWLVNTRRMAMLVREFPTADGNANGDSPHCGIVITPWLGTSIPWFSLAMGLLLARQGNRITFLFDDQSFGATKVRFWFVTHCLRYVMESLRTRHRVMDLGRMSGGAPLTAQKQADAERLAGLNAVWELRGEMTQKGRSRFAARCEQQLRAAYPAISLVVRPGAFDLLFIPGGVWGTSGIWTQCARSAGIRIGTFDNGGYGSAMLAANGLACQLQDIPEAFARIKIDDAQPAATAFAVEQARAEMARRRAGLDTFMSQVQGSNGGDARYDGAILIALNSSWDSAALGLHTVFADNCDWIVRTVHYLLENTDAPVVVRQHPAERLEIARTNDDYRTLLRDSFGNHPRLHFIAAAEKINSYELMVRVRALVVHTSTIGIEAAAHGKPVITTSNSYYSNLGFVHRAASLEQYQTLLQQAALGSLHVEDSQRHDALLCYYITQCCNFVFSPFNPADFNEWSRVSLTDWYADPNVQRMLKSLRDNVPVAYLNHIERMAAASSQAEEAAA